jgi:hypothetical protein
MKAIKKYALIPLIFAGGFIIQACTGVQYVDNQTFEQLKLKYNVDLKTDTKDRTVPRQLGGLMVPGSKPGENPHLVLFKREKGKYLAETMLSDNTDDSKAMFKKTYLTFGANKGLDGLSFEFRLTY